MSDIETLKLKDTKLINQICDLGDITIDKRRRWSIEFDDYGMSNVIDAIRADERARFKTEAVEVIKCNITHNQEEDDSVRAYVNGFNDGLLGAIETIKAIKGL